MKLAAIRDALHRAGLKPPTVDVEISAKPFEQIFEGLIGVESGSRAEYLRPQGIPDGAEHPPASAQSPRELPAAHADAIYDAQIVSDEPDGERLVAAMGKAA